MKSWQKATLQEPKLLLLDEHTAALDPKTAAKVLDATQRIVEKSGLTTMMITHNMRDEEKKHLTVEQLLNLFSQASGSNEVNDKLFLS